MLWHQLTDLSQLQLIKHISEQSATRAVLIFKHSGRCGISSMALNRLESKWADNEQVACYLLDVVTHRDISNQLALDYQVKHESPQVLLIKNDKCIYNASHSGIMISEISEALERA